MALDLDGTVLTDDKRVTPRTKAAIEAAAVGGTEVIFVTGRPFFGIPDEIRAIKGVRYIISSNGAVITDVSGEGSVSQTVFSPVCVSGSDLMKTRRTVYSALLDRRTASEIVREALDRGLLYSVYTDGMGYCERSCFNGRLERYEGTPIGEYIKQSVRVTDDILGLIQDAPLAPENVWVQEKDREARDRLHRFILNTWKVNTVLTSPTDIEIGSPKAGKGNALSLLSEKLGTARQEILAMGDNFNDLEMFGAAGVSVAMGNAPDGVKAAASFVAPGNEEDGVAAVLEMIL